MNEKNFSVIRVYPKSAEVYDRFHASIEFLPMSGYQRWISLRESNTLKENLDVYVKTNIEGKVGIDEITSSLRNFNTRLSELLSEAEIKFDSTDKYESDWMQYQSDKCIARDTVNKEFTEWLESTFEKLNFNETV